MMELGIYIQYWCNSTLYEISTTVKNCSLKKWQRKIKSFHGENITIWIPKFITIKTPILSYKGKDKISRKVRGNSWKKQA